MAQMAIALPCLPGGGDRLRQLAKECAGDRRAEFEEFHRRVGLQTEQWYLQQTPQGEVCIVVLEGDPPGAMAKLAASEHDFDRWFRDQVKAVHGVDFALPPPGPPPEQIFSG
jgi:hypothetical protein